MLSIILSIVLSIILFIILSIVWCFRFSYIFFIILLTNILFIEMLFQNLAEIFIWATRTTKTSPRSTHFFPRTTDIFHRPHAFDVASRS